MFLARDTSVTAVTSVALQRVSKVSPARPLKLPGAGEFFLSDVMASVPK
jgi:hypothetical protein